MNKKHITFYIIVIFILVGLVGGISYSYFVYNKDIASVSMNPGTISLNYSSVTNSMSNLTMVPMNDYDGMNQSDYIDFTVTGTVDIEPILYELVIIPSDNNTLDSQYVKLYLTDQNDNRIIDPFLYTELYDSMSNTGKGFYQEIIDVNSDETVRNYSKGLRLRVWIDENYNVITGESFDFDLNVYSINASSEYQEKTFYINDGRKIQRYYTQNETLQNAPHPVRDGYTFVEWNDISDGLPYGYVRYDYVETSESQYFDSGYIPNNDTRIKIDFRTPSTIPTDVSTVLFFSGISTTTYGFALGSNANAGKMRGFYKTAWNGDLLSTETRYNLLFDKEKLYLNNSLIHTFSTNSFTAPYTLPFFAQYYQSANPINFAPSGTRIYSIEIFDDTELKHYFVPVLNTDTNEVGFYDMIDELFYNSLTNGSFTGVIYSGDYSEVDEELLDANFLYAKWIPNI